EANDAAHRLDLLRRARDKNDLLRRQNLMLPDAENRLPCPPLIDELPTQTIGWRPSAKKAPGGIGSLSPTNLRRQIAAELSSHRSFDRLHDRAQGTGVRRKGLRTVDDLHASFAAEIFVGGALVRVLKP